ncbi:MAG: DinB family protein [Armatimonadota bacterium]|nr:DinB family protein [Armatimonadota bacterium]
MGPRQRSVNRTISTEELRRGLKSQYHACLAMLRATVRLCPDDLWFNQDGHANPFWRIAYHTLYYTHLYLQPNNRAFRAWEHHQRGIQRMDSPLGPRRPYTRAEVLAYGSVCDRMVDDAVDALDLAAPQSGFRWYRMPKLEHQIVNIRHVQYHQAQLADRLRAATGAGVGWADARRTSRARQAARRPRA